MKNTYLNTFKNGLYWHCTYTRIAAASELNICTCSFESIAMQIY